MTVGKKQHPEAEPEDRDDLQVPFDTERDSRGIDAAKEFKKRLRERKIRPAKKYGRFYGKEK